MLPLSEFHQHKEKLLKILKTRGGLGHFFNHYDFDIPYEHAVKEMEQKGATKMQIVRFQQIMTKALKGVIFNPYTGD